MLKKTICFCVYIVFCIYAYTQNNETILNLTGYWQGSLIYKDDVTQKDISFRFELKLYQDGTLLKGTSFDCNQNSESYCICDLEGYVNDNKVYLFGNAFYTCKNNSEFEHLLSNYTFTIINNKFLEGYATINLKDYSIHSKEHFIRVNLKKIHSGFIEEEKHKFSLKATNSKEQYFLYNKKIDNFFSNIEKNEKENKKIKRSKALIDIKNYKTNLLNKNDSFLFINSTKNKVNKIDLILEPSIKKESLILVKKTTDSFETNKSSNDITGVNSQKQQHSTNTNPINSQNSGNTNNLQILKKEILKETIVELNKNLIDSISQIKKKNKTIKEILDKFKESEESINNYSFEFYDSIIYIFIMQSHLKQDTLSLFYNNKLVEPFIITQYQPQIYSIKFDGKKRVKLEILNQNKKNENSLYHIILKNRNSQTEYQIKLENKPNQFTTLNLFFNKKHLKKQLNQINK